MKSLFIPVGQAEKREAITNCNAGLLQLKAGEGQWIIGVASVRSCEKFPPCPIKPVPSGSKTDPPLAKAKPIRDSGSTSGITYFRRGKKLQ